MNLFYDQTEARRAEKKFFTHPPLSQGLDFRAPPSSEGLDSPLIWFTFGRLKGHESFFSQWRGVQIKKNRIS